MALTLTIGVAADANMVVFERIEEDVHTRPDPYAPPTRPAALSIVAEL